MAYCADQTLAIIAISTGLLGLSAGILGAFAFAQNQGMLGDAISHAALPGAVLAFLCTHSTNALLLCSGGMASAVIGILFIELIVVFSLLRRDAAIAVVLSVFFGIGLVLLTIARKYPLHGQSLLNRLLFGNAATITIDDLYAIATVTIVLMTIVFLLWKEFLIVVFDHHYAQTLGLRSSAGVIVLMLSIVTIVSIGLQTTGGILMSTLLLAPAAAARQWTTRFSHFVFLAGFFGMMGAMIGSFMSALVDQLPTGPAIVLVVGAILTVSLLFGCGAHVQVRGL